MCQMWVMCQDFSTGISKGLWNKSVTLHTCFNAQGTQEPFSQLMLLTSSISISTVTATTRSPPLSPLLLRAAVAAVGMAGGKHDRWQA